MHASFQYLILGWSTLVLSRCLLDSSLLHNSNYAKRMCVVYTHINICSLLLANITDINAAYNSEVRVEFLLVKKVNLLDVKKLVNSV